MKLFLMPKEPTWWIWLITVLLLAAGLVGYPVFFVAAILLCAAQSAFFLWLHRSWTPYPVQIRVGYTACLALYLLPGLRWMFWVPMLGTMALILFGYCPMARILSLMPWNRTEPFTADLVRRTFLTPPVIGLAAHGLPAGGCPGGVCVLEAGAASAGARPARILLSDQ